MQPQTDAESTHPIVSVGVPVYNGARHLRQALDSLLNQTFRQLEIIISDNASTDDTQAICEHFASRDHRVRYLRQPRNIGAPRNWSLIVHEARGEYFKWASANDYCNERFVEDCVRALEDDPRAALSFGKTLLLEEDTGLTTEYDLDVELLETRARDRYRRLSRSLRLNNAQSGVIRLDILRKTGLDRPYPGGDLVLMAELALYGHFKRVPSAVLYRRVDRSSFSSRLAPDELRQFINPDAATSAQSNLWRHYSELFPAIAQTSIGIGEKLACLGTAVHHAYWDKSALARELSQVLQARLGLHTRPDRAKQ